jgi:thiamine pyrophosphokinase
MIQNKESGVWFWGWQNLTIGKQQVTGVDKGIERMKWEIKNENYSILRSYAMSNEKYLPTFRQIT